MMTGGGLVQSGAYKFWVKKERASGNEGEGEERKNISRFQTPKRPNMPCIVEAQKGSGVGRGKKRKRSIR